MTANPTLDERRREIEGELEFLSQLVERFRCEHFVTVDGTSFWREGDPAKRAEAQAEWTELCRSISAAKMQLEEIYREGQA